jgi:hypothetical protein
LRSIVWVWVAGRWSRCLGSGRGYNWDWWRNRRSRRDWLPRSLCVPKDRFRCTPSLLSSLRSKRTEVIPEDLLEFCTGRQSTKSKKSHNPTILPLQTRPVSKFSWRSIPPRFRSCSNRKHRSKLLTLNFRVLSPLPNKTTSPERILMPFQKRKMSYLLFSDHKKRKLVQPNRKKERRIFYDFESIERVFLTQQQDRQLWQKQ